ncbi:Peptidoglycan/LPS O-acetylase OafA/YrhL, contains acyltransferase and SGNH-hydrolase domains [Kaistia soli DSM 19436]|uniref:Peptidoglycan/LPS O-acetylase OafA/YrhL, contains acyltransferase and SGNH-hydrolase domains n=1 Tax=Kaistia soli DSM 19436 TaxID=1122133 RepID=A0A1M5NGA6_9HYPH|nr:Peptidoglycan/LPS O-acetylase OafA/YrhL, contains acyltransferase and SGNH-hydrolase domains [Kaistia soli DSM 19436]
MVHHVANAGGWSHGAGAALRFGQEAVIVFFLLSGFVIFANEQERAIRPAGYYLRRLRRIYPPLIAAMLISTAVALLNGDFLARFRWEQLFGTVFALQDISFLKPGVIVDPYLGNDPLWSLSYEILFYLIFPPILMAWRWNASVTNHAIGAGCAALLVLFAIAPNHFSLVGAYFMIWWSGAMAAYTYTRGGRSVLALGSNYVWLLVITVLSAIIVYVRGFEGLGFYPFLIFRHFAVALLMLTLLYGPIGRLLSFPALRFSRLGGAIASISYGLYVFHYPLLVQWNIDATPYGFVFAALLLVAVAYATEHLLPRILPAAPRS